jgi:hypothetical protein
LFVNFFWKNIWVFPTMIFIFLVKFYLSFLPRIFERHSHNVLRTVKVVELNFFPFYLGNVLFKVWLVFFQFCHIQLHGKECFKENFLVWVHTYVISEFFRIFEDMRNIKIVPGVTYFFKINCIEFSSSKVKIFAVFDWVSLYFNIFYQIGLIKVQTLQKI